VNLGFLTKDLKVSKRNLLASILLISGTLTWFFLLNRNLYDIFINMTPNEPLWKNYFNVGQGLFYGFAILSAVVGSLFGKAVNRRHLLITWILLGTFSTILLTLSQGFIFLAISSALLGISLGLGLPISMAFLGDCTEVEERARVAGIIIFSTFVLAFICSLVVQTLSLQLSSALVLFAFIRLMSVTALVFGKCDSRDIKNVEIRLHVPRVAYKEFLYYLFPWVMFCMAAGLASNLIPSTSDFESAVSLGNALRFIFIALFGIVSGVVADRIGRKPPIIIGLIMLGVSFALLGFSISYSSVIIYMATSGIAWGLFFVIYLAIPGDLSTSGSREKCYAIGYVLPLSILFALAAIPGWAIFSSSSGSISQLFSILLFLSIVPILLAKESLPREKIQDRKMKEHLKNIEKLIKEDET
jgi:MFS family permease